MRLHLKNKVTGDVFKGQSLFPDPFCLLSGLNSSLATNPSPWYCCLNTHLPKNNIAKWPWMNFRPSEWLTEILFFFQKIHIFFYIPCLFHFWNNFQMLSKHFQIAFAHMVSIQASLSPVENRLRYFFLPGEFSSSYWGLLWLHLFSLLLISHVSPHLFFVFPSLQLSWHATQWFVLQCVHTVKWSNQRFQHINYLTCLCLCVFMVNLVLAIFRYI